MQKKTFIDIRKKFPFFRFDFLPYSDVPRLRILFSQKNYNTIKKDKDQILKMIFGNKSVYGALMFFSGNEKSMRKIEMRKIELFGFKNYLNHSIKEVIHIENNLFGHIFMKEYKPDEIIFLSDIIINLERQDGNVNLPHIDFTFFIFDTELKNIGNVYSFKGFDIASYDKNNLGNLRNLLKDKFELLDDKIK